MPRIAIKRPASSRSVGRARKRRRGTSQTKRPERVTQQVNVDFPEERLTAIDREPMAEDKFQIAPGATVEFDAAKGQMTITRPEGERVFTMEKSRGILSF